MKNVLVFIVTICVVCSLFFFIRATDLATVLALVQKIGYRFVVLLLCTFVAYVFGTLSWQFSLGAYWKTFSIGRLFLIRHLGETVGMLNPASVVGGDAFKAVMLGKYEIPEKNIVWSMLFSRGIMVISQLLLFFAMVLILLFQHPAFASYHSIAGRNAGFYALISVRWRLFRNKLSKLLMELPLLIRENKRMLSFSVLFALLHWVFGGLEFYFILKFLGLKVTIVQALLVDLGVVLFKAAGAFIPGQLGIEEYGNKIMLMVIGLPQEEVWVTASILRRARQLFWIAIGIITYFILFGKKTPDTII
ncbi:MAG: hypothetical protein EOO92_01910 [Pedobacter sp.]|nr:MAG: hypothetical protein EOO92_01910 [Pedobacter sp.]